MSISYKSIWLAEVNERLKAKDGYPGIYELVKNKGGRFVDWDKQHFPNWAVETDLAYAVSIGCIAPENPYYTGFLAWAVEAGDRALSDPRFDIDAELERVKETPGWQKVIGWKTEGDYPGNHGSTLVAASLARALGDGAELDQATLLLGADEITESALNGGPKFWDYIAESEYLRGVRLALVAGNVEKAQYFLKNIRRKFKHTFVHQEWLQALANVITAADGAPLGPEPVDHFQKFFDQVRDPACRQLPKNQPGGINLSANMSILRLELAIIKQRYILVQPLEGNWPQVLGLISE